MAQATLSTEDAGQVLARIANGDLERWALPWLPLLRGAAEPVNIAEWKRLAAQEPDSRSCSEFAGLAVVFAHLAGTASVWRKALKGWNMTECAIVNEWQEEARRRPASRHAWRMCTAPSIFASARLCRRTWRTS